MCLHSPAYLPTYLQIRELKWSSVLASTSARWAEKCIYDHNHWELALTDHGQNLAASPIYDNSPEAIIDAWAIEVRMCFSQLR